MTAISILFGIFLGAVPAPETPANLAEQIDHRIDEALRAKGVVAAPIADDAEFLRRIYLDLIGRIPSEAEARRFLADSTPSKRTDLIDRLLADPRHFEHFAHTWRELLLPEAETDLQVDYFRPGLEAWLRERREKNVGFDVLVRELIAVPIAESRQAPEMVLRDLRRPNALGFFAAKDAKPENLAGSATRLFLGVRLECAQCHDHPSGQWTRQQFWNQAAFFAGLERQGTGVFAPLVDAPGLRSIPVMLTKASAPAVFLDRVQPTVRPGESARAAFAAWMTSRKNTQFARATVNRVWGQLLGIGLVEPVDDFHEGNPASHPALLEEMAIAFRDSGFDLTHLIGGICRTHTYQRTSRQSRAARDDPRLFSRMAVKKLSGEQFVDSLLSAVGLPREEDPLRVGRNRDPLQQQLLDLFSAADRQHDPQTSILQALALMNGALVNAAVIERGSPTLTRLAGRTEEPMSNKLDSLYLATLSRFPTNTERQKLTQYLSGNGPPERQRRPGDVLWMLLNSVEFRCNH